MTLRVRYTGTELCPEGVVENIYEANAYTREEDGSLRLREDWYDEDTSKNRTRTVGHVEAGRWQSIVSVSDEVSSS